MYFNVFGERVSRARYKEMLNAAKNRRELIAAGYCTRRDLMRLGLLTSAGLLAPIKGLSARAQSTGCVQPSGEPCSAPVTPFVDPLPIMPVKQALSGPPSPAPTVAPNTAINPATGLPFEGRTRDHQVLTTFPPQLYYQVVQQAAQMEMNPALPLQTIWGFDGIFPGPTYVARYGTPILVRNFNELPTVDQNGGFGLPSVTTHLHNGHTPSESDGFMCDYFAIGQYYDQHYPNVLAGILDPTGPFQGTGDINEALSTLWYHDHRVGFTAQNTYKGLVGYFLLFNQFDTGDETTGFHLPSFPTYDIPMVFADKNFDPETGLMAFDLFALDGLLGDTFTVNGKVQPFLEVQPRRYRFRLLNVGPSRFYQLFVTDLQNNGAAVPYWLIANDGNLLPKPVQLTSIEIPVAGRMDVIVDFTQYAGQTLYLENRLQQISGQGPTGTIVPGGKGNLLLKIIVRGNSVEDNSADPSTISQFYPLPSTNLTPTVTRIFKFDRLNGMWSINGQFADCDTVRFTVKQNTAEHWVLTNFSGDWEHPIHIHLEEHQIISRNQLSPPNFEVARKDVSILHENERVEVFERFRDFTGRYILHCHNTVHEDNAMLLRWEVQPEGDTNRTP
jgi:FtsP/CotA-like multicopper oxidase with cupredoxin domain